MLVGIKPDVCARMMRARVHACVLALRTHCVRTVHNHAALLHTRTLSTGDLQHLRHRGRRRAQNDLAGHHTDYAEHAQCPHTYAAQDGP